MVIHCIIHPLVLGRKYFNPSCGIELVVSSIMSLSVCGFLSQIEAEYPDFHYYTTVLGLSTGKDL